MQKSLIFIGLIAIVVNGMERQNNFLLDSTKSLKKEDIQKAHADLLQLPMEKMKGANVMLSETLIILSAQWSDDFGDDGLRFANSLIAKGANPYYPKVDIEEHGEWSSIAHTETAIRLARGRLLEFFNQMTSHNLADK